MQTITAFKTNGIFKASGIALDTVNDTTLTADLTDAKDEILVLVELPSEAAGGTSLVFASSESAEKDIKIPLAAGKINHILITTKGIKGADGSASFTFENSNNASASSLGVKMCFVKHISVINN